MVPGRVNRFVGGVCELGAKINCVAPLFLAVGDFGSKFRSNAVGFGSSIVFGIKQSSGILQPLAGCKGGAGAKQLLRGCSFQGRLLCQTQRF